MHIFYSYIWCPYVVLQKLNWLTGLLPPTWIHPPTNSWPLSQIGSSYPKREEICKMMKNIVKPHWPIFSLLLNHLRYRKKWKLDKVVWPRRICWLIAYHFLLVWGLENSWNLSRYPHPITDLRKSVNHNASKWEHLELKHPTHHGVSMLGISLTIFAKLNTKYSKLLLMICSTTLVLGLQSKHVKEHMTIFNHLPSKQSLGCFLPLHPMENHATKTMPSYTSKTRLTRLFTRLRQVSTSFSTGRVVDGK